MNSINLGQCSLIKLPSALYSYRNKENSNTKEWDLGRILLELKRPMPLTLVNRGWWVKLLRQPLVLLKLGISTHVTLVKRKILDRVTTWPQSQTFNFKRNNLNPNSKVVQCREALTLQVTQLSQDVQIILHTKKQKLLDRFCIKIVIHLSMEEALTIF